MNTKKFKFGELRYIRIDVMVGRTSLVATECLPSGEKKKNPEGFILAGVPNRHEAAAGQAWRIVFRAGGPTGGYWHLDKKIA